MFVPHHNVCHEQSATSYDKAMTALLSMMLQQQISSSKEKEKVDDGIEDTPLDKFSSYIKQIQSIHDLRIVDSISEEEYENIKGILMKKVINSLGADENLDIEIKDKSI